MNEYVVQIGRESVCHKSDRVVWRDKLAFGNRRKARQYCRNHFFENGGLIRMRCGDDIEYYKKLN